MSGSTRKVCARFKVGAISRGIMRRIATFIVWREKARLKVRWSVPGFLTAGNSGDD